MIINELKIGFLTPNKRTVYFSLKLLPDLCCVNLYKLNPYNRQVGWQHETTTLNQPNQLPLAIIPC